MVRTDDDDGYRLDPVELYDIREDPYQTRNLRDKEPAILRDCEHRLNEWLAEQRRKPHAIPDPFGAVLQERRSSRRD
jgi:hypothetical protein